MLNIGDQRIATVAASAVVSALILRHIHLKYLSTSKKITKFPKLSKDITWLNQDAYEALIAVCDTLVPSLSVQSCSDEEIQKTLQRMGLRNAHENIRASVNNLRKFKTFLCAGALENGTPSHVAIAVQNVLNPNDQKLLSTILTALSTTVGNFALTGYPVPFKDLSLSQRENVLLGFQSSAVESLRALFQVFKRLVGSIYLSFVEKGEQNPNWESMDYNLLPSNLSSLSEEGRTLKRMISYDYVNPLLTALNHTVDVVIVGSGCGGGVMAYQLVNAGYSVLVLEKGGYYRAEDFANWTESEAMARCFEKGGLCSSVDSNMLVLAGACVGGGSTINWSASFATPDYVLKDWAEKGLDCFADGTYVQSMQAIHKLMGVNTDNSHYNKEECGTNSCISFKVNLNNQLLWQAAESCGYTPEKIPRNVKNCVDCGHCCYGCRYNAKQSTLTALMEPILLEQHRNNGNNTPGKGKLFIVPDCTVSKITMKKNKQGKEEAEGVEAEASIFKDEGGSKRYVVSRHPFKVKAKVVISSCGALHTPALLKRSGLTNPLIGAHLCLHPVLGAGGLHTIDKDTGLSRGVSMGVVVRKPRISSHSDPTHPVAVQTPPVHSGLLGVLIPWLNGLSYKISALCWKNISSFIVISRDHSHPSNRITIDNNGDMVIHYRVQEIDKANMLAGLGAALEMTYRAGAKAIFAAHSLLPWYEKKENDEEEFQKFKQMVMKDPVSPLTMLVCTAHQMSSCRMAASPKEGPVAPTGELYDVRNVFVADASILPTSLGINPMITIESVTHMLSAHVVKRLQEM